jgi:hypothetical protein|tara:strand:- start:581 stop:931 length:351 start_codon:yes stop_codon:yes gene_type:complete
MVDTVSLVNGDNLANLQVTLVREDTGGTFALTNAVVRLYIRKKGTTGTPLATITHNSSLSTLGSGIVVFQLGTFTSSAVAGFYEGEVEVTKEPGTSDESKQTVFEAISIRVRDDFS